MNLRDTINRGNQPSTTRTIRLKAWKHTSGRDIFIIVGDVVPALSAIGVGIATGSFKQGLIWGAISFGICSYVIVPLLSGPWLLAPSRDEFRTIVQNFYYNADNDTYVHMAVGSRRFWLYCEIFGDDPEIFGEAATYMGLILPRKYWDDMYDEGMRSELLETGVSEVIEKEKNIYTRGPRDFETVFALVNYLMQKTGTTLNEFATEPVTSYAVHVFSDLPPAREQQKIGVKKK